MLDAQFDQLVQDLPGRPIEFLDRIAPRTVAAFAFESRAGERRRVLPGMAWGRYRKKGAFRLASNEIEGFLGVTSWSACRDRPALRSPFRSPSAAAAAIDFRRSDRPVAVPTSAVMSSL